MNPMEIIEKHISELCNDFYVSKLGIFGSFARGEAKETSDVDILVEFDRIVGLFHFIKLQYRLAEILGREVDLGQPKALKSAIKDDVLKEVKWLI